MNPLKQYFRRPAIYLKLPSEGKYYPAGSIDMPLNGELPVFPMTAIDELTSKTPDSLFNGTAIIDIIKSCVPAIKDPWKIPSTDLNAILIAIRTASSGSTLSIDSQCPSCETVDTYGLNLSGVLQTLKAGDYTVPLKMGDLNIYFRPLDYKIINDTNMSQFDVQITLNRIDQMTDEEEKLATTGKTVRLINENLFKLVALSIERIELPSESVTNFEYILEYVKSTDKTSFDQIKEYSSSLREQTELKPFKITCSNCGTTYDQPLSLNASDFFG